MFVGTYTEQRAEAGAEYGIQTTKDDKVPVE